jgi:hypothetical protein
VKILVASLVVGLSIVSATGEDISIQLACKGKVVAQGAGGRTEEMSGSVTIRRNYLYVSFMPEPCTVTEIYDHGAQFLCPQLKMLTDIAVGYVRRPWPFGSRGDVIDLSLVVTHLPPTPKAMETKTDYQLSCELRRYSEVAP